MSYLWSRFFKCIFVLNKGTSVLQKVTEIKSLHLWICPLFHPTIPKRMYGISLLVLLQALEIANSWHFPPLITQFCPTLTISLFSIHLLAVFTCSVWVPFLLNPSLLYHLPGGMAIFRNAHPHTGLCSLSDSWLGQAQKEVTQSFYLLVFLSLWFILR